MRVIVVGIGRMGCGLAQRLDRAGKDVYAVDKDPKALETLGEDFRGKRICGVGFDRDVLQEAGVERATALVSCTSSDDANIVCARLAHERYRVPTVIARLYDLGKAETYRRLGIQAISTTDWGIRHVEEMLTYSHTDQVFESWTGDVSMVRVAVGPRLDGAHVGDITALGEVKVACVTRGSRSFIPTRGTQMQAGDVLFVAVATGSMRRFRQMAGIDMASH